MPTFRYKGYRSDGREASGTVEAESLRNARELLRQQEILPAELLSNAAAPVATNLLQRFRRRIPVTLLALFSRRLATLVAASVPIHEALTALHHQEQHPELRALLGRVRERLAEGAPLARALAEEPQVFRASYVAMVAAGEASGALDRVLQRLADFLERQEELQRKVSGALAYPLLMAVVGSGVMLFLLTFVIPKITGIFADNKAALPFLTVALLTVSSLLRKGWWLLVLLGVGLVYGYQRLARQETFLARRDRWLLKIPVVGGLLQTLALARFARILALMLSSGVPLLRALEISAEAVVNRAYRAVLAEARTIVAEGGTLSGVLHRSLLFPPLLTHLIAVGEQSGTLEASLETAGQSFEREFEATTGRAMALLEPLLVLAMGVAVGLVVMAVLLPIFQLNQLIK